MTKLISWLMTVRRQSASDLMDMGTIDQMALVPPDGKEPTRTE